MFIYLRGFILQQIVIINEIREKQNFEINNCKYSICLTVATKREFLKNTQTHYIFIIHKFVLVSLFFFPPSISFYTYLFFKKKTSNSRDLKIATELRYVQISQISLFECSHVFLIVDIFLKDCWCSQYYSYLQGRQMHISGELLQNLDVPLHSSGLIYSVYKWKLEHL